MTFGSVPMTLLLATQMRDQVPAMRAGLPTAPSCRPVILHSVSPERTT